MIISYDCNKYSIVVWYWKKYTEHLVPTLGQAQIHYNESRRFIKNKSEVSDELFKALNKIERFNAAINRKTQTKINILFR